MADYTYESELVADPFTFQRAANSAVSIYDVNDESESTPLALKDLNGLPMPNPLTSSADAFVPPFVTTSPQVKMVGGGLRVAKPSFQGVRDEAVAARMAAQDAQISAENAAADAGAAVEAALSEAVSGANSAAQSAAAAAMLINSPADAAIATAVASPGTSTREAVTSAVVTRTPVTKAAGATIDVSDPLLLNTWDEQSDFLIRLPASSNSPAGTGLQIRSLGAGVGRVIASQENLFPFPNAKAGYAGGVWSSRGPSALTLVPGAGPDGMDVIRATATGASSSGGFGHSSGNTLLNFRLTTLGLRPGDVISVRAWLAPPAASTGRIQIRFYRNEVFLSEPSTTGTTGIGYRHASNITIPTGATHFALVSYSTSAAAGDTSDITAISMQRGTAAVTTYIDGSTAGGYWWGLADQSPSSIGKVLGDPFVPAGGQSSLTHEGGGVWRVSPVGPSADTMRDSDILTVDRDNGQLGMFAPAYPFSTSDTALTSGRAMFVRFVPTRDMMIQGIGFRVTTASGTDDPVDAGIYSSAGMRLVSTGAVTGKLNATGTQIVPLPAVLVTAGKVYYAALSSASTASLRRGTVLGDAFGTAMPAVESAHVAASHPLPSSVSSLTSNDAPPLLILREVV